MLLKIDDYALLSKKIKNLHQKKQDLKFRVDLELRLR